MLVKKWLIINKNRSARITKGAPYLKPDEVALALEIELPDELFRKPRLEAHITIPKEAALADTITAKVVDNIQEAVKTATGLTLSISVIKDEEVPKNDCGVEEAMESKGNIVCAAKGPQGFGCTRIKGHEGEHHAHCSSPTPGKTLCLEKWTTELESRFQ